MFQRRSINTFLTLVLLYGAAGLPPCAPAQDAGRRRAPEQEDEGRGRRLRPPTGLNCSRNELTSFTGRVLTYSRSINRIFMRMRTDEQTTESFTLNYRRRDDPSQWFLLRAEPFGAEDWRLIESRQGRLRPGMRATVWVCSNSRRPVIDWQPPER